MIYITGDIHGEVFRIAEAVARFNIGSEDIIVLLGDVGMNYYGNKCGDRHRKKRLNKLGVPMFCIHGNHEMRPGTIPSYHEVEWHGGAVYVEDDHPNLLFAKDGEVYDLDGQKTIVIGGAYSVDKWYRLQCDLNWFPDEQPSEEIKAKVEQKLHELGWRVDAVLTHTCPERIFQERLFSPAWIRLPWTAAQSSGWIRLQKDLTIVPGSVATGILISELIRCTFCLMDLNFLNNDEPPDGRFSEDFVRRFTFLCGCLAME